MYIYIQYRKNNKRKKSGLEISKEIMLEKHRYICIYVNITINKNALI